MDLTDLPEAEQERIRHQAQGYSDCLKMFCHNLVELSKEPVDADELVNIALHMSRSHDKVVQHYMEYLVGETDTGAYVN